MVHLRMFNPFGSRSGGPPDLPPPPSGPRPPDLPPPPSGNPAGTENTSANQTPAFRAIELDGIGTVEFRQGPEYSVTIDDGPHHGVNITIGDEPESLFGASVRDGVLRLESGIGKGKIVIRSNPPAFRVTGPHLERITIKGAAKAKILSLTSEALAVSVDGAGDILLTDLHLNRLHVRIGGAGKLSAIGKAREQEIEITGAGSYSGEHLLGSMGKISINGAGKATVSVADQLQIAIGGVGAVTYFGNPAIEQKVGGLGRVRRA